jgi:PPK2 family polyphosphate:nucleotide phosphotransferase
MSDIDDYKVDEKSKFNLSKIKPNDTGKIKSKEEAAEHLQKNIQHLAELQEKLAAQDKYGILIIFQAMDTAGKDGAIKHVMSGLNPQGTKVHSFKKPSDEDLDHDYLWRSNLHLPSRGMIGIFNRSYYEEVLVVRVHNLLKTQQLPAELITDKIWDKRFRQIRDYETYLYENGIIPVKFFLHISKGEQKKRLLERIDNKDKNWKFAEADIKERAYWDKYQECYEEMIRETSTSKVPWYVIPADNKWYARYLISKIINKRLEKLDLEYPKLDEEQTRNLEKFKAQLLAE